MHLRNTGELKADFLNADEADFSAWLATQPEGAPPPPSANDAPTPPSLQRRIKNLAVAVKDVLASDHPLFAKDDEAQRRLGVCNACPLGVDRKLGNVKVRICTHIDCGCLMGLKTKLGVMSCPEGKW